MTTHWTPVDDRLSSRWMLGTAMETIVWSMKVIATAKIIAASTQLRPCMLTLTVPLPAEPPAD